MTQQQAIDKRMAQIKRERDDGRNDCAIGLEQQRYTLEYTIGYGDERQRQLTGLRVVK